MTHGRKPRRERKKGINIIEFVIARATRHTAAELEQILAPIRAAHQALREGVASELQWTVLDSSVAIGRAIEDLGVVRGLREHMRAADQALDGIRKRAMASGEWKPTALYYQELDDVAEWIRLHAYQLEQLSAGELKQAHQLTGRRAASAGIRVVNLHQAMEQGELV